MRTIKKVRKAKAGKAAAPSVDTIVASEAPVGQSFDELDEEDGAYAAEAQIDGVIGEVLKGHSLLPSQ